jgi:hypothetical protein
MKPIYVLLFLLLSPMGISHAQDMTLTSIFTFENNPQTFHNRLDFTNATWGADSQSFNFRYTADFGTLRYYYDIPTNQLHISDAGYPCAYTFTDEQTRTFGAVAYCSQTISPNGRYVIYPTAQTHCGESCLSKHALGDLKTGKHTNIEAWFSDEYTIIWSENSSAFLISDDGIGADAGGLGGIWYVSIPDPFVQSPEVPSTMLANFPLGEQGYVDISPDGEQVLVRGGLNSNRGLSLWNTSMPSSNQQFAAWSDGRWLLKDQNIGGATFLPDDPQHILVVTNNGIVKYDLKTDSSTTVNTDIKNVFPNWVYFSPDVQYALAYTIPDDGSPQQKITLFQLN